jgi:2-phosphoglycerate kinase
MIYLVGGAPRAGKSILGQQVARRLNIGWVATDVLRTMLVEAGLPQAAAASWDASPEAIAGAADWFFPHLERFAWGIGSLADSYLIEGVHFLPRHVAALGQRLAVRSVFIGCSQLTLERFEQFPGRSRGYAGLPADFKRQIVADVPRWSSFIAREAQAAGCPYVDTSADFAAQLAEAERVLVAG